jgi:sodium-coupled monocarboxylate transporter 8/12
VLVLFYGTGLVLYAFYKQHGDPLAAGLIAKEDQILPYFVVTQLPAGLPGLLIAAVYAASMSTISAGLNSLASATVVDFQQRLGAHPEAAPASPIRSARWITVCYGVLVMALAFAVSAMPGNLVESVNTIIGLIGGPLLGLFFLGMFTERATARGALTGCLVGFVSLLSLFLYQSGAFSAQKPPTLIAFVWFSLLGTLLTMGVGLAASGLGKKAPA